MAAPSAPVSSGGPSPLLLVVFIIVLAGVWTAQGGVERGLAQGGPFLRPNDAEGRGTSYGFGLGGGETDAGLPRISFTGFITRNDTPREEEERPTRREEEEGREYVALIPDSPYSDLVRVSASGARRSAVADESIVLTLSRSAKEPLALTGWTFESGVTGNTAQIGSGTEVPRSGTITGIEPIVLAPGDKAIVSSGRSPIGSSFRVNLCTGYLEQYQDFSPALPKSCPRPLDEYDRYFEGNFSRSEACEAFVKKIPSCSLVSQIPPEHSGECGNFVISTLSYNSCVSRHERDTGFKKPEWRVFLGRSSEFWKNDREVVRIRDAAGRLVAEVAYR